MSPFGRRIDGVLVLQCAVCAHGIVEEFRDDPEALYGDEYFSASATSGGGYADYACTAEHGIAWAAALLRILKPRGRVLDIGCANGRALQLLGEAYDCFGIELNESMARQASESGVRMIGRDLLGGSVKSQYAGSFDAVLAIAVFEHIPDFKEAIRAATALLKPDGVLIFEVPAIHSSSDIWFRSSLEHLHYPTKSSLEYLFREVLHLWMTGSVIDIQDFGCTYVGVTSPGEETARVLQREYQRLTTSDPASLQGDDARFRWYFDVAHAAHSRPELLALHRHLKAEDWTPALRQRLFELWAYREEKLKHIQAHLQDVEAKAARLAEQAAFGQQELGSGTGWLAGALKQASGIFRCVLLAASPRMLASNFRNLLLGLKLVLRGGEGTAVWNARFDSAYYKNTYRDIERSGVSPALHYLLRGHFENRNPSERFDSAEYYTRRPDVRRAGINPLLHYALFGIHEGSVQPRRAVRKLPPRRAILPADQPLLKRDGASPLVTVVIPCFNYGQYVEEAIRSVLSQTFTNLELIVVEGGSTDGTTPEVLREMDRKALPKTRFVYRTEPHLAGDNRNFGIRLARGRYICCLDADDLIKPTYLEVAVFLAALYGYDIVYPSVRCFGESDLVWDLKDPTWPEIANENQVSTVAMFRRAAWEQVGGFRDWGKGDGYVPEDWEFWVRLVGHGFRGANIPEPLMRYRYHHGGLWNTSRSSLAYQRLAIREASPGLFVERYVPPIVPPEPAAISWSDLTEPDSSSPAILLALPFITIGGAEKLFATFARSLVRRGYKVVIVTTAVPAPTIRDCTESFEDVTPYLYPLPRLLQEQEDCWGDFLRYLLKRHHIGTILIAGSDFLYRLLPEIAREFPRIAVLDQLFNDGVHYHTNRRCAAYIDGTIVPSQALAGKLVSGGEQSGKVFIIPHGVQIEELRAQAAGFDSSGLPEEFQGKFLVSFFGRLSVEKAPADFVEIARLLKSNDAIRFVMTGEGPERAAVLALIARYGLTDRIYAPGFVDNVPLLMALSDVIVVPSALDGMPLVVFEAQGAGKPVVASAVGSIPDVIADGKTGFLCGPGDVRGFAERILKLWRSPELRRAIGEAAAIWVRANHGAESMTAKYVDVFERVRAAAVSRPAIGYNGP